MRELDRTARWLSPHRSAFEVILLPTMLARTGAMGSAALRTSSGAPWSASSGCARPPASSQAVLAPFPLIRP